MSDPPTLVWGAEKIAETIGVTRSAVYHMLENKQIPGARKIGGRWALHLPTFYESFKAQS